MKVSSDSPIRLYVSKHCTRLLLQIDDEHIAVYKLSKGGYLISTKIWMHTNVERVVGSWKGYSPIELNGEQLECYSDIAKAISVDITDCFSLSMEDLYSGSSADSGAGV
jgi:hypothetical protein